MLRARRKKNGFFKLKLSLTMANVVDFACNLFHMLALNNHFQSVLFSRLCVIMVMLGEVQRKIHSIELVFTFNIENRVYCMWLMQIRNRKR